MEKKQAGIVFLFFTLLLTLFASAADPVLLEVDKALIYANPGQSFTLTFTVQNPYADTGSSTIDQFDLYFKDISESHLQVIDYAPVADWNHARIVQYDDEHFSKSAFSEGSLQVTFKVNENAPAGKFALHGYFNYYGEVVDFSQNPLGEPIAPVNDDENYQFATLVVTREFVNPVTAAPLSGSDAILMGAVIIILAAGAFLLWKQHQGNISKKKSKISNKH